MVFGRLAVYVSSPVGVVIYLAEHGILVCLAVALVGEGVEVGGLFVLHDYGGGAVVGSDGTYLELRLVDDGRGGGVEIVEG